MAENDSTAETITSPREKIDQVSILLNRAISVNELLFDNACKSDDDLDFSVIPGVTDSIAAMLHEAQVLIDSIGNSDFVSVAGGGS